MLCPPREPSPAHRASPLTKPEAPATRKRRTVPRRQTKPPPFPVRAPSFDNDRNLNKRRRRQRTAPRLAPSKSRCQPSQKGDAWGNILVDSHFRRSTLRYPVPGAVAQLGERRVRNAEVRGSIPLGSTPSVKPIHAFPVA